MTEKGRRAFAVAFIDAGHVIAHMHAAATTPTAAVLVDVFGWAPLRRELTEDVAMLVIATGIELDDGIVRLRSMTGSHVELVPRHEISFELVDVYGLRVPWAKLRPTAWSVRARFRPRAGEHRGVLQCCARPSRAPRCSTEPALLPGLGRRCCTCSSSGR